MVMQSVNGGWKKSNLCLFPANISLLEPSMSKISSTLFLKLSTTSCNFVICDVLDLIAVIDLSLMF